MMADGLNVITRLQNDQALMPDSVLLSMREFYVPPVVCG